MRYLDPSLSSIVLASPGADIPDDVFADPEIVLVNVTVSSVLAALRTVRDVAVKECLPVTLLKERIPCLKPLLALALDVVPSRFIFPQLELDQ